MIVGNNMMCLVNMCVMLVVLEFGVVFFMIRLNFCLFIKCVEWIGFLKVLILMSVFWVGLGMMLFLFIVRMII